MTHGSPETVYHQKDSRVTTLRTPGSQPPNRPYRPRKHPLNTSHLDHVRPAAHTPGAAPRSWVEFGRHPSSQHCWMQGATEAPARRTRSPRRTPLCRTQAIECRRAACGAIRRGRCWWTCRSRRGEIRLGSWRKFSATQAAVSAPGYIWAARASISGVPVVGYHRLSSGSAEMRRRLLSLIPVVTAQGPDITGNAAGRLPTEFVMMPTAFRAATWRLGDGPNTAVATWRIGAELDVEVHVDPDGQLLDVLLQRWSSRGGAPLGYHPFGVTVEGRSAPSPGTSARRRTSASRPPTSGTRWRRFPSRAAGVMRPPPATPPFMWVWWSRTAPEITAPRCTRPLQAYDGATRRAVRAMSAAELRSASRRFGGTRNAADQAHTPSRACVYVADMFCCTDCRWGMNTPTVLRRYPIVCCSRQPTVRRLVVRPQCCGCRNSTRNRLWGRRSGHRARLFRPCRP